MQSKFTGNLKNQYKFISTKDCSSLCPALQTIDNRLYDITWNNNFYTEINLRVNHYIINIINHTIVEILAALFLTILLIYLQNRY